MHHPARWKAALAEAARDLGAEVTLVHAPLSVGLPVGVQSVPVRTADAMRDAVCLFLTGVDILIAAAAVADFRPAKAAAEKIKKRPGEQSLTLELVRNPDILAEVVNQVRRTGRGSWWDSQRRPRTCWRTHRRS